MAKANIGNRIERTEAILQPKLVIGRAAGAIAGLQGYSFAKLGVRYPTAGGLLEYVAKGFGDGHFTGITAWLTYSANAIVTAMVAVSFGSTPARCSPGATRRWSRSSRL